tara:strand:- start:1781 stop:2026 length:246 start_codon:yes stop_codon:yes gene_type:complete
MPKVKHTYNSDNHDRMMVELGHADSLLTSAIETLKRYRDPMTSDRRNWEDFTDCLKQARASLMLAQQTEHKKCLQFENQER